MLKGQRGPAGLKGDRGNDGEKGEPGLLGPRGYLVSFQFSFSNNYSNNIGQIESYINQNLLIL